MSTFPIKTLSCLWKGGDLNDMDIQGRFRLNECTRIKMYAPPKEGNGQWESVEGIRVKLLPVGKEPWGSATPSGDLEMVIANPIACQVFLEAPIHTEFNALFSRVEGVEDATT